MRKVNSSAEDEEIKIKIKIKSRKRRGISEQFADGLGAVIDEREGPRVRAGQMRFKIETETVIDCRNNFVRSDRAFDRVSADFVALADDASAFYAAAREITGPALRPVVASAGGIDFRRAAELGEIANECGVEHAALDEIFDERAVALVIHGRDDVFHAGDAGEGFEP